MGENPPVRQARIVGWHLVDSYRCACGASATVIVEEDGCYVYDSCGVCVPKGTEDPIAAVVVEALSRQEGKPSSNTLDRA